MGARLSKVLHWTEHLTDQGAGRRKLALASFLESTVVPVPLEVLVAPLMIARPQSAFRVAFAIWLGCLAGALVFYLLGAWLFAPVVAPMIEWLGWGGALDDLTARLGGEGAFLAIVLISLTPVPFQIATLGAGAAEVNLLVFLAAVALSRGIRYFGLALLAQWLGPRLGHVLRNPKWRIGAGVGVLALLWAGWALAG